MKTKKFVTDKVSPEELMKHLVEGNKEYMDENLEHFQELRAGQKPDITLVACCDSRVPPDVFGVDSLNEVFTIRNIGNQFRNSEGSIKYSILHLKTPIVIIMGHTGCGAVNAALGDYREEDDGIQREVVGLTNSIRIGRKKNIDDFSGDDSILKNSMYAETNVDHQVRKLLSDYNVKPMVESGKIVVIGMMLDIHGAYEVSAAHVHVTNVNGITDTEKIKKHRIFSKLTAAQRDKLVKRLMKE